MFVFRLLWEYLYCMSVICNDNNTSSFFFTVFELFLLLLNMGLKQWCSVAKHVTGRTMLDLACFRGCSDCVESLLLQGSKIITHDDVTRRTPLHSAGVCLSFFLCLVFFSLSVSVYNVGEARMSFCVGSGRNTKTYFKLLKMLASFWKSCLNFFTVKKRWHQRHEKFEYSWHFNYHFGTLLEKINPDNIAKEGRSLQAMYVIVAVPVWLLVRYCFARDVLLCEIVTLHEHLFKM